MINSDDYDWDLSSVEYSKNIVSFDINATIPVTIKLSSVELFMKLCQSLSCNIVYDIDKYGAFKENYTIYKDKYGRTLIIRKDSRSIVDERGELIEALLKIGSNIIPNWENRI